ncbi:facilitated trehalose transporter Tret1-like [Ostrinia nubilalis]|uniref:facilitated trehalose transporter Tret1-like n=1 Tax=Ostrinia nubilalis TaxID=29057 RepID=UPI00308223C0
MLWTITIYAKQILIALVACLGQIMFGYAAGWPSPVISKLNDPEQFPQTPSLSQTNWIVSILLIGSFVGTVISGPLSNVVGRKPCLIMGAATGMVSFLLLALIKNPGAVIAFRFILGAGISVVFGINLVYIGEIAATEVRGMLLGCTGIFNSLGFLLVYSVGTYVSYEMVNYIGMIVGAVFICGIFFMPETPIFHIIKDREEDARSTFLALNRKEDAEKISEMKMELEENRKSNPWKTLLQVKCNRKALILTSFLYLLQQTAGVSAMLTYTTLIFEIAGSSITPYIATIIVGAVNVLSGCITPLFVERFGRRPLLLTSTFVCGLALMILSVYIYLYNIGNPVALDIRWLPLPVFIIYCISNSFGFLVLPGALVGEMFQLNVRGVGSSIAVCVCWLAGFSTVTAFAYIIAGTGTHVAFAIFSASCGIAFLFTLICIPETKGKSLIEVQKMLS